jgi:cytochrome c oxidase subunit 4
MSSSAEDVKSSIKVYLFVFGALASLTIITVAAKELNIGVAAGIAVALLIASVKGTLVASYFMHLVHERSALYWILGLCALFFLAILLIPVMQTSETEHLINPVYQAAGDKPLHFGPDPGAHAAHGEGHEATGHEATDHESAGHASGEAAGEHSDD